MGTLVFTSSEADLTPHRCFPGRGRGAYIDDHENSLNQIYKCSCQSSFVTGSVSSFFIFMKYHLRDTYQASPEIGVVFCICLQFLYRHGESRGSSFVSARYLSRPQPGALSLCIALPQRSDPFAVKIEIAHIVSNQMPRPTRKTRTFG